MRKFSNISIFLFISAVLLLTSCRSQKEQVRFTDLKHPKREFRGVWVQTAYQDRYRSMNSAQMQAYFVKMLDEFQAMGMNAVIFQVRPQADAFYRSDLEPWSHLLTGTQGKAPDSNFDPTAFLIEECHKRNMEFHAWLNPYRVGAATMTFARNHLYNKEPNRFVKYGKLIYFDPGLPENKDYICKVVDDIVRRYNVDAIHMDDYFYPYPIAGEQFPDNNSFNRYARQQGFNTNQRDDWRRNNVNTLIKELKYTIARAKPWVRFGISPFGIYRNKRSTPDGSGSNTNGLQNYDDLYADIKLWVKNGWIDYNMPQIYWEIGHKAADYTTLINWWADNNFEQPLYIGQDMQRTMDAKMPSGDNQLSEKMRLSRSFITVDGNCFWYGYLLMDNYKGSANELKNKYHKYPALIPAYTHMHKKKPKAVKKIRETYTQTQHILEWEPNGDQRSPETGQYFVIYRFPAGQKEYLENAQNIVTVTRNNYIVLPYEGRRNQYKYVVTTVDAFHNESKGKSKKVKL